jgi:hypothetical protein
MPFLKEDSLCQCIPTMVLVGDFEFVAIVVY